MLIITFTRDKLKIDKIPDVLDAPIRIELLYLTISKFLNFQRYTKFQVYDRS